ncbi:MAG: diaminopimelate epimerase [Amylibacter sp.]|nr:diaminopimelate epimerase [Amylibacter sp.]|tara:strand:- start:220 stop:1062 length:843 start_codon:yes stop_codon:yes gene_type:complete
MKKTLLYPNGLPFLKMHGLGNDFVIIDARHAESPVTTKMACAIGERHFGVGYDQLVVMTKSDGANVDLIFWNSDGTLSDACGNASRCIARLVMAEIDKCEIIIRTGSGLLVAKMADNGLISVNMGQPQLVWNMVPLKKNVDLISLPIEGDPGAVGMGNPHCVFVVDNVDSINLIEWGSKIENHELFPERTNVEFIQIINKKTIRQRTFERGAGVTLACGSGACAVAVVAHRKGLTDRKVEIQLDGGSLQVDWRDDGVWMTGPTTIVFEGNLSPEFLESVR